MSVPCFAAWHLHQLLWSQWAQTKKKETHTQSCYCPPKLYKCGFTRGSAFDLVLQESSVLASKTIHMEGYSQDGGWRIWMTLPDTTICAAFDDKLQPSLFWPVSLSNASSNASALAFHLSTSVSWPKHDHSHLPSCVGSKFHAMYLGLLLVAFAKFIQSERLEVASLMIQARLQNTCY